MDLVQAATFGGDERGIPPYRADGDPTVRLAGRVIVLDPANRVLLFRYDDPLPFGVHWATPGGGLDPGEDFHAGALRELREETGWTDVPVGRAEVLRHDRPLMRGAQVRRQHERFFAPSRIVAPLSMIFFCSSIMLMTGCAGFGSNSVLFAPFSLSTLRANSITAICRPRQRP